MTLLEAKVDTLMRELGLTVREGDDRFEFYKEGSDRYEHTAYLYRTMLKEPPRC